jgi:predicted N-acyltransferase
LRIVEAGAQGEHKLARGYMPVRTWSSHWIAHRGLSDAVERFLAAERARVNEDIEILKDHSPFRKQDHDGEK